MPLRDDIGTSMAEAGKSTVGTMHYGSNIATKTALFSAKSQVFRMPLASMRTLPPIFAAPLL